MGTRIPKSIIHIRNEDAGFTLVELITVVVILASLALIALQSLTVFKSRAYNGIAQSDMKNILTAVTAGSADPDDDTSYSFADLEGPITLPDPIAQISLSNGVKARYIIRTSSAFILSMIAISVYHPKGTIEYSWIKVGDAPPVITEIPL